MPKLSATARGQSARIAGLALVATVAAGVAPALAQVVHPVAPIATSEGLVAGKVLASGVHAWFGIPFAKPPTQDLRWKAPQPIKWDGVWNADRLMPECIQVLRPHDINHYFGEEPTSENCLYLNVWAPATSTAQSKLPVIVFLYGGGGTIGSSGSDLYGGEAVARKGAVYVNFNYRVGVLGFMAHPELTKEQGGHSGNYGYLDQTAALKWVHDNIARFGGDPAHVVIMGQSAGAGSVVQQTYSPLAKGLFQGAVMSSGCTWGSAGGTTLVDAEKIGLQVQSLLGATNLSGMRAAPADKILATQSENQVGVNRQGVRTGAIIDGYFMPDTQAGILKARALNNVNIIASFNHDEAASPLGRAKTVAEYQAMVRQFYGKDADGFLALYPVTRDADIAAVSSQVARDNGLARNARGCAQTLADYGNGKKAYIDMFSQKPSFAPGVVYADMVPAQTGAYHTADIPFWFGTQDVFNKFRQGRAWTAHDRELSSQMMDSLITFAKTGSPATARVKWTAWSDSNDALMEFGDSAAMTPLNAKGIDWLKAHPVAGMQTGPGGPAPGRIEGGPRD